MNRHERSLVGVNGCQPHYPHQDHNLPRSHHPSACKNGDLFFSAPTNSGCRKIRGYKGFEKA